MDLKDLWNSLDQDDWATSETSAERWTEIRQESKHPMARLRGKLWHHFVWNIALAAAIIGTILYFLLLDPNLPARFDAPLLILLGVIGLSSLSMVFVYRAYRSLPQGLPVGRSVRESLEIYLETIRSVMRIENRMAYVLAVPSPLSGAVLYSVEEGATLGELVASGEILVSLVAGIIAAPLVIFLTRWLNKLSFGKGLREIEALLEEMDSLEGEEK